MPQENLKLGKRTPKRAPSIKFRDVYRPKVALPPHPPVDYLQTLGGGWQMYGNNLFGTCVAADQGHKIRLLTTTLGEREYYPTLEEVYALYRTQNAGFVPDPENPIIDNGMDYQTLFEWWTKHVWAGHKLLGFAQVDHHNLDEMRAATSIVGTVSIGVQVQRHNFKEFDNRIPWTYDPTDRVDGGHGICGGAHFDFVEKDQGFISWKEQAALAQSFEENLLDEYWVLIFIEHLGSKRFMANMDMATFKQAYEDFTHRRFPAPIPPAPDNPGCSNPGAWANYQAKRIWKGFRK